MGYLFKVGKNNEVPLPDDICDELDIKIGDILICEVAENSSSISMKKHCDQTLSDDVINSAGNLTRVIPYFPEQDATAD
jgi:bifunctional DNA-binding transcriptional regulator/antitoxin component of YhaV-PrlF toxin-antitoxin module